MRYHHNRLQEADEALAEFAKTAPAIERELREILATMTGVREGASKRTNLGIGRAGSRMLPPPRKPV